MQFAQLFRWFVRRNQEICDWIEGILPRHFTRSLLYLHELGAAAEILSRDSTTWVLDMGGGGHSPFAHHLSGEKLSTVVALDILEDYLRSNSELKLKIVGDVCGRLPLRGGAMDVVVTRSVLEHLRDSRAAVNEIHRILAPGGVCIHVFPARFSPFSLLNQIIPEKIARRLLFAFFPEWSDHCGFRAFYRNCDAQAMAKVHADAGFVIRTIECRYYQSIYYKFFVPLYIISLSYDAMAYLLNWPLLACQIFLVAEKQATPDRERSREVQRVVKR